MRRPGTFGLLLAAGFAGSSPASSGARPVHHAARHHAGNRHVAVAQPNARGLPTPTCRYPDGTPYDPDIIGGANHVGDGGPAANLGGFDPCGS